MQERITKRAGRFVRLLAGRPPAVSKNGRRPRDQDIVAARRDPPGRPPAAGDTLASRAGSASYVTARPVLLGRLTASGALLGMLLLCLVTCLVAAWRQLDVLAGIGFCAACVLAPVYARRAAQLTVAVSAPVVFLVAEIVAQSITAPGSAGHGFALSVLEGTFLALANVAPWLFAGTAVCIAIAMFRGLPQCVRDLRTGPAMQNAGRAGHGAGVDTALRSQHSQRS